MLMLIAPTFILAKQTQLKWTELLQNLQTNNKSLICEYSVIVQRMCVNETQTNVLHFFICFHTKRTNIIKLEVIQFRFIITYTPRHPNQCDAMHMYFNPIRKHIFL